MRRVALLEQRQELMLRTVEAAHAAVAFSPDDEIDCGQAKFLSGCNDCGITSPIDERPKKAAVAEMRDGGTHPRSVERPELVIAHLPAGHWEFTVISGGDIASNRRIVGLIGKHEPRPVTRH